MVLYMCVISGKVYVSIGVEMAAIVAHLPITRPATVDICLMASCLTRC